MQVAGSTQEQVQCKAGFDAGHGSMQDRIIMQGRIRMQGRFTMQGRFATQAHIAGQGRFTMQGKIATQGRWRPLGHVDFLRAQLEATTAKHSALLQAIPNVPDVQSAWLLLLHCASVRANYQVRVLRPDAVEQFARTHDARVWQCLCNILKIPEDFVSNLHRRAATLLLSLGGLGLRSAVRTSVPAHWASWADVLPMIRDRHPAVATMIVNALDGDTASPCVGAVRRAAQDLAGVEDFEVPQWRALAAGLRPPPREPEEFEPGSQRAGWQHEASTRVEREFRRSSVLNHMSRRDRALLRSQSGPVAGVALSTTPSSPMTRMEPALFRVLLQRRLALPLPLSNRTCRCGRPLDAFGHHRAACARCGVLGRRGFALESAAGRVCREAGTRVATNQFVRDLDLGVPNANDNRRFEVVADAAAFRRGPTGRGHNSRFRSSG